MSGLKKALLKDLDIWGTKCIVLIERENGKTKPELSVLTSKIAEGAIYEFIKDY